jgi:predicted transcriptional regulator
MPRKRSEGPTDAELAILKVLWSRGPSTVREIHSTLSGKGSTTYTTTLKLLQIMLGKGLVDRDDSRMAHVYRARASAEATRGKLLDRLLDEAFEGSAGSLVLQALSRRPPSETELAEIRRILEEMEQER